MNSSLLVKVRLSPRLMVISAGRKARLFCMTVWASSAAKAQTDTKSRIGNRIGRRIRNAPHCSDILLAQGRLNRPESGEKARKWARKPGLDRVKSLAYTRAPFGKARPAKARDAGWSSPVARQAHNLKVTGSNPVPATKIRRNIKGLKGAPFGALFVFSRVE